MQIEQLLHPFEDCPQKGYLAVYVGEESNMKRFVIPVSYLNQPSLQDLLKSSRRRISDLIHPMGGLTIPCREDLFVESYFSLLNA
uniref:Small auxin up regulated protein n=1 Tax=Boehmeria nivea TaxID=83906 RepID=A0A172J252_BOENI|nr:small auxin up regulated protein [Boehmeria nivea]